MNRRQANSSRRRGIMLVECMIYIGVSAVLIGLALLLFYRCMDASTGLTRNVEDITQTLGLGERWREDLRRAVHTPAPSQPGQPDLVIPLKDERHVIYRLEGETILRWETGDSNWSRLLKHVAMAEWNVEHRTHVSAWHFDIELQTKKPNARLRPLFSFVGVAGGGNHP